MLESAIVELKSGNCTCIVMQAGKVVYKGEGRGVKPLLGLYNSEPNKLIGSIVADKVIGKAAAIVLVLAGAAEVYGKIMSERGKEYLEKHNITCSYGELVHFIQNRTGTDMCPLEKAVKDMDEPQQGFIALREKIDELMKVN